MAERKIELIDPRKLDYFYEEALKTLRTNIQYIGKDIKSILFTSCFPNEGKSDVTMQLARELGNMNKKVIFVDTDIRKSALLSRYQVQKDVYGLSHFLSGQVNAGKIVYSTNYSNLDIIVSGPVAPNPSELLEEKLFGTLIEALKVKYDYVLLDTPPIRSVTDAAVVAKRCDGAVLVIESEAVSYRTVQKAKEQLEKTDCRILGAVLNKVDTKRDKYYSKYDYYYSSKEKDGTKSADSSRKKKKRERVSDTETVSKAQAVPKDKGQDKE